MWRARCSGSPSPVLRRPPGVEAAAIASRSARAADTGTGAGAAAAPLALAEDIGATPGPAAAAAVPGAPGGGGAGGAGLVGGPKGIGGGGGEPLTGAAPTGAAPVGAAPDPPPLAPEDAPPGDDRAEADWLAGADAGDGEVAGADEASGVVPWLGVGWMGDGDLLVAAGTPFAVGDNAVSLGRAASASAELDEFPAGVDDDAGTELEGVDEDPALLDKPGAEDMELG